MLSATAVEGPGSWEFKDPKMIKLGVCWSATTFQKTSMESVGGSMISGTSATSLGSAGVSSVRSAGVSSVLGSDDSPQIGSAGIT